LNLQYTQWADARILEAASRLSRDQALADRGSSFGGILGTLEHIYKSQRVWLTRFTADPRAKIVSLDAPADTVVLSAIWPKLHAEWLAWAGSVADWDAGHTIWTAAGQEYTMPLWQMVLHVINHSTYHRGQVTTMLRQAAAAPPPSLDLITFYREQAALTRAQASQS
jgi:uncharacterized damage-inducible protein DinB